MSLNTLDDLLYQIPVQQPPDGQTSNFVDPPSRGQEARTIEAVFASLMLFTVVIRAFVRIKWTKVWGWSDYACLISAFGSVAHMALVFEATKVGFGRHMWDVPIAWVLDNKNIRLMSSMSIVFPVTVFFAKVSILLLYLQVFSISTPIRISIHIGILIMALFYAAMVGVGIGSVVQCVGLRAQTLQFCINASGPIPLLNSSFNVITDFWILILPMPLILKLQLPKARKIGLIAVFAAGLAACGASLARLVQFTLPYPTTDMFWDHADDSEAGAVEMNIAIMVSCANSLPTFFVKTKTYLHSTTSSIRNRILPFVESRSMSQKPSGERDDLDPYSELRDFASPAKPTSVSAISAPKLPRNSPAEV